MFLTGRSYYQGTSQACDGRFLMVFSKTGSSELRVLVRRAEMRQSGHFMTCFVNVKSEHAKAEADPELKRPEVIRGVQHVYDGYFHIWLSGAYGHDGLPIDADQYPGLWEHLHPVPADLTEAFWKGGGHNSAGSEGPQMKEWAESKIKELTKLI